ncbi:MAG TPA: NAD(P)-dependent oxidoreductase [Rariglobus sp.]|nr:NAD(P)-dependent oxidoreductase [Rariglobus sp.]
MSHYTHRIVLTGASGTLGGNFAQLAAQQTNLHVLALLREQSRAPVPGPHLDCVRVDFEDKAAVQKIIQDYAPTCLVHCAATGMDFPKPVWFDLIRFNVDATINLCEAAARLSGCKLIFISTGLVYGWQQRPLSEEDPLDTLHPYGASKAAADMLVRAAAAEFGVPLTILRPFSFTGPGDDRNRLFPSLLRAAAAGQPALLSAGDQLRDHCSARDIAAGILAAILSPSDSSAARIFNLGSGSSTPLREVILQVVEELDLKLALNFGARDYGRHEPRHFVANIERARRELGWTPRHNLAHAVWQLAQTSFPELKVREPSASIS